MERLAECSKSQPARPQRVKEAYPLGYVEALNDARTKLAGFLSILPIKKRPTLVWNTTPAIQTE